MISLQSLQDSAKNRYLDFGKESIWWFWCFKENYAPLCYLFISTTFSFINMERPNYKLQALTHHCKSILELYDRSLCIQRFHRFTNKRNRAQFMMVIWLSGDKTNSVCCNKSKWKNTQLKSSLGKGDSLECPHCMIIFTKKYSL